MATYEIRTISYDEALPLWQQELWVGRLDIEQRSAIVYGRLKVYDVEDVAKHPVTFFGAYHDDILVGVNSGHGIVDGYRSRGLYVQPQHRGLKVGKMLLQATILQAVTEGWGYIWSIPRLSAVNCYISVGFIQRGGPFVINNQTNVFAKKMLVSVTPIEY